MPPAIRKSHSGVYTAGSHSNSKEAITSRIEKQRQQRFSINDRLAKAGKILRGGQVPNLKYLLPLMLNLNGEPYNIDNHFPFEPFFNTRMIHRLVLKCGRQVSKTARADSKFNHVYDEYGRRHRLADIEPGQTVQSFDTDTFRSCCNQVLLQHDNPVKPCYYIRTRRGVEMELADTHPLYTYAGWTAVAELDVGDRIIHVRKGGRFGSKRVGDSRIRITAYMLGDGSFRGSYNFTANRRTQAIAEMRCLLQDYREYCKKDSEANSLVVNQDHVVYTWAAEDNLHGKLSHEKRIPGWVFLLSKNDARTFIERLWATDGTVKPGKSKAVITYTSTSRELVYDLKSLLVKFGIPTCVKERTGAYKKPDGRKVECRQHWVLRVETVEGWQTFLDEFDVPDKPGFELPVTTSNNNRYTVPAEISELIADLVGDCRGVNRHARVVETLPRGKLRKKPKYPVSRGKLREYLDFFRKHRAEHPRLEEFAKYVDRDADWDEIVEIRNIGKQKCVDIEVDTNCNYLFDGVLSHNSTSLASQGIVSSNCIPYFNTLYVTPLYEMIRRFSSNYVAGFIRESPVRRLMVDHSCSQNVLQRGFRNESKMFFSFAFQNCDRTRGLNTSKNCFDEVQDLDPDFVPIINETMSGSKYGGIEQHTGTPKTLNGTLEKLWLDTSRAQWHIWCEACGRENIPSIEHDLERMTGPDHVDREISEDKPGLVCSNPRCERPLFPRNGHWVHHNPSLRNIAEGYHVPQQIMPMHYADSEKWGVLLGKRSGFGMVSPAAYWNEVCGESYDEGARLITQTELQRACSDRPNALSYAEGHIGDYVHRVCSVDWGGGGQKEQSYTVAAVLGMKANGDIDVLYGWRSRTPHDHNAECREIFRIMATWHCTHLVHDYNGAGDSRETILVNAGYPARRVIPMVYMRAGRGPLMRHKPYNERTGERAYYQLDKARTLVQCCNLIRYGKVKFFKWDGGQDSPLISDFLSLTEDMVDSRLGSDVYTIIRDEQAGPDDFAHAVNMGTCALFWRVDKWPNMAELAKLAMDPEILRLLDPTEINWDQWD